MNDTAGRLAGRRILITGGASGIGAATAALFAAEGARILLLDRAAAPLEKAARRLGAIPVVADVTDETALEAGIAAGAEALGGLDGLVNGAGILTMGPVEKAGLADWERTLAVNLTGPFLVSRAALPWLRRAEAHGTIVNVASGIGLRPLPGYGAYAAAKAGLIALTRVMAAECAPLIRVNAVCPGAVVTPMTEALYADPQAQARAGQIYALGRLGQPEEIARAILFLTGSDSSYVTGVALPVDGGRTFH